jgi:pimeloyl-ACP methyl ester carboxylesterase
MARALLQEATVWAEAAALTGSPLWRGEGFPLGRGRPVVLVPGFLSPEWGLRPLANALERSGWRTTVAATGMNVDCTEVGVRKVMVAVEDAVAATGRSAAVLGHSRGGQLALACAARRPEHVGLVVTMGTATDVGLPRLGLVRAAAGAMGLLSRFGAPRLGSLDCGDGSCCTRVRAELDRPVPTGIVHLALVATRDGFVPRPYGRFSTATKELEVATGHLGLAVSIPGWTAVAEAMAWA